MKGIFLDIDGTLTPLGSSVPPDSAAKAISVARARGLVYQPEYAHAGSPPALWL